MNIATRGFVGTGDDVLIGGLIIEGHTPINVTLRARAQSMIDADPNLEGRVLDDVSLQLFDVHGNLLIENDDWEAQTTRKPSLRLCGRPWRTKRRFALC